MTHRLSPPGEGARGARENRPARLQPATRPRARAPASSRRALARGQVLDGVYEIGELLGSGGMGQVYEAVDRRSGVVRALKVCHPGVPAQVLEAEARALAAVEHAGIVRVRGTGTHEGTFFLVMDRLHGHTLRAYLQQCPPCPAGGRGRGPFALGRALDVLIHVTEALAALHERGFLHRDLKPSNIILTPQARPVLLDLGVSCPGVEAEHEQCLAGSPHYIAPEVITASITRHRAPCIDIYALGVISFEMLTGRRPFEHHSGVDPLRLQLYAIPPRASDVALGIPEPLDQLVDEMLRKEAEERPRSARAVADRLGALQHAAGGLDDHLGGWPAGRARRCAGRRG